MYDYGRFLVRDSPGIAAPFGLHLWVDKSEDRILVDYGWSSESYAIAYSPSSIA